MRSKVTKVLDKYYFKELTGSELAGQLKKSMEIKKGINTLDQLSSFLST
jgi:hypothetical protein